MNIFMCEGIVTENLAICSIKLVRPFKGLTDISYGDCKVNFNCWPKIISLDQIEVKDWNCSQTCSLKKIKYNFLHTFCKLGTYLKVTVCFISL